MLILSAHFSRRKRAAALLIFIFLGLLVAVICHLSGKKAAADSSGRYAPRNEQRVAFLQSYGWTVESRPIETLNLPLGKTLQEPFLSYNDLQRKQGFDLAVCCGKTLQRYSYKITNYPGRSDCQANLYLCDNTIVAGDITCLGDNGFVANLQFPSGKSA